MKRVEINEELLEKISGGSIVLNDDCTTCGLDCNDEYKVNDLGMLIDYVSKNMYKKNEDMMLKDCAALGYITRIK